MMPGFGGVDLCLARAHVGDHRPFLRPSRQRTRLTEANSAMSARDTFLRLAQSERRLAVPGERRGRALRSWVLLLGMSAGCSASMHVADSIPPPPASLTVAVASAPPAPVPPAQPQDDTYDDQDPTALMDFHSVLDAHGSWATDPIYGTVWIPSASEVGPGFVPYLSAGNWIYKDDYIWASRYDWGWVPFHYGRWASINGGWGWIPGRKYAPAWVEWQIGQGYVGWAPTPPTYIWVNGDAAPASFAVSEQYVFCEDANLFSPTLADDIIVGPNAVEIRALSHAYVEMDLSDTADISDGSGGAGGGVGAHGHGGREPGRGPPPALLGIAPSSVAQPTGREEVGLAQAKGFARPSSAQRLGAHAPVKRVSVTSGPAPRVGHAPPVPAPQSARSPQPARASAATPARPAAPTARPAAPPARKK